MDWRSYNTESKVEKYFLEKNTDLVDSYGLYKMPVVVVDNYVELGQLTALRFLEWVALNPGGVIALPTGKTPEFFIKWTQFYLQNWDRELKNGILAKIGLEKNLKPDLKSLHFFQLDEFFPISPEHERSFTYFVKRFYVDGFGLDPKKTHLINTYEFTEAQKKVIKNAHTINDVFPDGIIDLGLRIMKPTSEQDLLKQKVIKLFDEFCNKYEDDILGAGGIGFFLGGIGPDGHIAFNVRGSGHHSHTRLTNINYETQAAAATDLGGIELVRKKAVITMGLQTITYNPNTVAVIIAAGEAKSKIVADAIENAPALEYPATSLHKLVNARFFLSRSTTKKLTKTEKTLAKLWKQKMLPEHYEEKLIIDGAIKKGISIMEIPRLDVKKALAEVPEWKVACDLTQKPLDILAEECYNHLADRIENGVKIPDNYRMLHTAPHHDDIELAYFPLLHHLVRYEHIEQYFCYCTSGFTSVTNVYLESCLRALKELLENGKLKESKVYNRLTDIENAQEDITGYLNGIASQNTDIQHFYKAARIARQLLNHLKTKDISKLEAYVKELIDMLAAIEPGRKEQDIIHLLKGWLREYEAELVWAHFGIDMDHVDHLRLHFYSDDIFPSYPDYSLDVLPILNLLEKIRPNIITLALDPEGSGPDTHYKTLIALADAIDKYVENHPDMNIRIWGYRNIWSRYDPTEVNKIIPVSLNAFAVLHNMFNNCFLSQKSASFPSFELDGTFSELAQKIWVEQHNSLLKLLGKDFFYSSPNPLLRRAYGAIYMRDMSYNEFSKYLRSVRRLLEAKGELNV
jgi:glucosamine-6-phosphate deaminase